MSVRRYWIAIAAFLLSLTFASSILENTVRAQDVSRAKKPILRLFVKPTSLNFGGAKKIEQKSFILTASGGTITGNIALLLPKRGATSAFSIVSGGGSFTLTPQNPTLTVTVQFEPFKRGAYRGDVEVTSDARDKTFLIPLSGSASSPVATPTATATATTTATETASATPTATATATATHTVTATATPTATATATAITTPTATPSATATVAMQTVTTGSNGVASFPNANLMVKVIGSDSGQVLQKVNVTLLQNNDLNGFVIFDPSGQHLLTNFIDYPTTQAGQSKVTADTLSSDLVNFGQTLIKGSLATGETVYTTSLQVGNTIDGAIQAAPGVLDAALNDAIVNQQTCKIEPSFWLVQADLENAILSNFVSAATAILGVAEVPDCLTGAINAASDAQSQLNSAENAPQCSNQAEIGSCNALLEGIVGDVQTIQSCIDLLRNTESTTTEAQSFGQSGAFDSFDSAQVEIDTGAAAEETATGISSAVSGISTVVTTFAPDFIDEATLLYAHDTGITCWEVCQPGVITGLANFPLITRALPSTDCALVKPSPVPTSSATPTPTPTPGVPGAICGNVLTDAASPVPGVMISANTLIGSQATVTDANGAFSFPQVGPGLALLSVNAMGFPQTGGSSIFSLESGESICQDIILSGELGQVLTPQWWGMFRHDQRHTGLSPYDTSSDTGVLKWTFSTGGAIQSSPAIAPDGTIYVGSTDSYLYAVNPDGTLKWKSASPVHPQYTSPAIGPDGTVYIAWDGNGILYAINSFDGSVKWGTVGINGPFNSSPTIAPDGTIYVSAVGLYAVTPGGTVTQLVPLFGVDLSSPAIGLDGTIYVGDVNGQLHAVSPDGTPVWGVSPGPAVMGSEIDASPAVGSDGTIYIGTTDDGKLYALNPSDGSTKWTFPTGAAIESSAAIGSDGTIYVGSDDSNLYAINPADGSKKWNHYFSMSGSILSSPAIGADGTIYVGTWSNGGGGVGGLFAINPGDGSIKWYYPTGSAINNSPAIGADGTIYMTSHDGNLYAIH